MKLSDELFSVHIIEALNTRTPIQWVTDKSSITGTGKIDGVKITLTVKTIMYKQYSGCNLSFATEKDGVPIETFRNEFGQQLSKIIGVVVNGFNDKLTEFKFDFLSLVAKNNVENRSSLYFLITERFARSRQMHTKMVNKGTDKIVLMIDYHIPISVITELE